MQLGEALSLRAKQAQKLSSLQGRITSNAISQEGEAAPEDANALIAEYLALSTEHAALLVRIANTNAQTAVGEETLLGLLQQRQDLIRQRNIYSLTAQAGSPGTDNRYRYMRSELRYVPAVDVAALRQREDEANEAVRALDAQVQLVNWATELV